MPATADGACRAWHYDNIGSWFIYLIDQAGATKQLSVEVPAAADGARDAFLAGHAWHV